MSLKSKFILKKLIIKNWGPFEGSHEIEFSDDKDKNITYIFGKNGAGKTQLFQAIKWILFSDINLEHIDLNRGIEDILNKNIQKITPHTEILDLCVNIDFESFIKLRNYNFNIEKRVLFKFNTNKRNWEKFKTNFKGTRWDGISKIKQINETEYSQDMSKYFPKGPRDFFILDGEKMADNFKVQNMKQVRDFTIKMSDIPIIDKTMKIFDDYDHILQKRWNQKNKGQMRGNSRVNNLVDEIKAKSNLLKKEEEKIEINLNELDSVSNRLISLEDYIKKGKNKVPSLNNELKHLRNDIKTLTTDINDKNRIISEKLRRNAAFLLLKKEINLCLEDIEEKRKKGILPEIFNKSIIKQILKDDLCVCNRELDSNSKEHLTKLLNTVPKANEISNLERFERMLQAKAESFPNIIKKLKQLVTGLSKDQQKKQDLISEKNIIEKEISKRIEIDLIDWEKKFKEFNNLSARKGRLEIKIENSEKKILYFNRENETSRTKLRKKRDSLSKRDPKIDKIEKRIELITSIRKDFLPKIGKKLNKTLTKSIEFLTFQNWKKLIEDPESWSNIKIKVHNTGKSWEIFPIKKTMKQGTSISQGQRHILGISFLTSLSSLFENVYPLIFDSPFGRLSQDPIKKVGENISDLLNGSQIILFVTDTEDQAIYDHISKNIGRYYKLDKIIQENKTKINEINQN